MDLIICIICLEWTPIAFPQYRSFQSSLHLSFSINFHQFLFSPRSRIYALLSFPSHSRPPILSFRSAPSEARPPFLALRYSPSEPRPPFLTPRPLASPPRPASPPPVLAVCSAHRFLRRDSFMRDFENMKSQSHSPFDPPDDPRAAAGGRVAA